MLNPRWMEIKDMTHINEFSPLIREPTPEHAQNAMDIIIPTDNVTGLLPNIFNRLDNHESSEDVAIDTVYNVIDIVEVQIQNGVDVVFNNGIVDRLYDLIINNLNDIIVRSAEYLGVSI